MPAPSLATLVETCGPLPVPAVRWLAAGCAEALESIHSVGLLHRDLKPSNVLVSVDGPQVIDFGVARAVERVQLTATREALGTPAYMAPEQARETRRIGPASDVFSLGSTLLYAATGHAPYQGETTVDVLVRLATEEPDLSGLPRELAETIAGCLERDPDRRPTPAALLAGIAVTMRFEHGDGDGARSLPGPALALIEEHRRRPPAALAPAPDANSTFGSHSSLPTSLPDLVVGPDTPAPRAAAAPRPEPSVREPRHRSSRSVDRWVVLTLGALLAVVLVGGGVAAGALLLGDKPATQSQPNGPPPNGRPAADPPPPADGSTEHYTGPPQVAPNQPIGDQDSGFVLHGRGWTPGTRVTVRVLGGRTSLDQPTVDRAGTFNYVVNQHHEFFPGGLPSGPLVLVATGPGGTEARVNVNVN